MAAYKALLFVVLAAFANVVSAGRDLLAVSQIEDVSIPWDGSRGAGSYPLPLTHPLLVRTATGLDPEQIHLTYVNSTAVTLSWATGEGVMVSTPLPNYAASEFTASVVLYGSKPNALTLNATGYTANYTQTYTNLNNTNPMLNYSSPLFHHVTLVNLMPSMSYWYMVGDPAEGMSQQYNFTMPPAVGSYPFVLGVIADLGQTQNSSDTLTHLIESEPEVITLIGDLSYADDYLTNGTSTVNQSSLPNTTYLPYPSPSGTFQPRWDSWYRFAQQALSTTPLIPNAGNHELEPQGNASYAQGMAGGRQFASYLARNPIPYSNSGSTNPLYYSVNVGPIHMVVLNNYENFAVGSPQYLWLQADLAGFNRTLTPWLIAQWHAPWYSSYTTHYMETECMREAMETLLYNAGCDAVFNGHLHEYERSNPVYNFTVNECGAVHIVIGDGGNEEGLYKTFIDQPGAGNCPTPNKLPAYQPGGYCPFFPFDPTNPSMGYCSTSQPSWSAFREPAFGHGILTIENTTHALWQWNRNWDSEGTFLDEVYIIRQLTCANKQSYPQVATASLGKR